MADDTSRVDGADIWSSDRPHTDKRIARFLAALDEGLSVASAAKTAGINRSWLYRLRARDATFDAAWHDACEAGTDRLEDEARRRAVEGVEKPVFRGGEIVGHVRDYSDAMLIFLLKARRPEIFAPAAKQSATTAQSDDGANTTNATNAQETLYRKFAQILTEASDPEVSGDTEQG